MAHKHLKIPVPRDPAHMATVIVAYAGIAKRLQVELAERVSAEDLEAVRSDLLQEAKKAIPHGGDHKHEVKAYEMMFEAIHTIFDPVE